MANIIDELNKMSNALDSNSKKAEILKKELESLSDIDLANSFRHSIDTTKLISNKKKLNKKIGAVEFKEGEDYFDIEEYYDSIKDMYDSIKDLEDALKEKGKDNKYVIRGTKREIHQLVLEDKKIQKAYSIVNGTSENIEIEDINAISEYIKENNIYKNEIIKRIADRNKDAQKNINFGMYKDPVDPATYKDAENTKIDDLQSVRKNITDRIGNIAVKLSEEIDKIEYNLTSIDNEIFKIDAEENFGESDITEVQQLMRKNLETEKKYFEGKVTKYRTWIEKFNEKINDVNSSNNLEYLLNSLNKVQGIEESLNIKPASNVSDILARGKNKDYIHRAHENIKKLNDAYTGAIGSDDINNLKNEVNNIFKLNDLLDSTNMPGDVREIASKKLREIANNVLNAIEVAVKQSYIDTKSEFVQVDAHGNKESSDINDINGIYRELRDIMAVFMNNTDSKYYIKGKTDEKGKALELSDRLPETLNELNKINPQAVKTIVDIYDSLNDVATTKRKATINDLDVLDLKDQMGVINNDVIRNNIEKRKEEIARLSNELSSAYSNNEIDAYKDAVNKLVEIEKVEQQYYKELQDLRKSNKREIAKAQGDSNKENEINLEYSGKENELRSKYSELDIKKEIEYTIGRFESLRFGANRDTISEFKNALTRLYRTQNIKLDENESIKGYEVLHRELSKNASDIDIIKTIISNLPIEDSTNDAKNNAKIIQEELEKYIKETSEIVDPTTVLKAVNSQNIIKQAKAKDKAISDMIGQSKYNLTEFSNGYNVDIINKDSEDKIHRIREELDKVNKISIGETIKKGDKFSVDQIIAYEDELKSSIKLGNNLREKIVEIQNDINSGTDATTKIHNLGTDLDSIIKTASKQEQFSLVSGNDIQRLNTLKELIRIIKDDASKISVDEKSFKSFNTLNSATSTLRELERINNVLSNAENNYVENSNKKDQATAEIEKLDRILQYSDLLGQKQTKRLQSAKEELQKIIEDANNSLNSAKGILDKYNQAIPNVENKANADSFRLLRNISRTKVENVKEGGMVIPKEITTNPFGDILDRYEDAEKELRSKLKDYILKSVENEEIVSGNKLPLEEKLNRTKDSIEQFVSLFGTESNEYIELLKRQRSIEASIEKESAAEEKARSDAELAEVNKRIKAEEAQERELEKQKQETSAAYNTILSTVRGFAAGVENTMKRLLGIIRTAINGIVRIIQSGFRVFQTLGNAIRRLFQLFGSLSDRVRSVSKDGNILKGTFTELKSKIDLLTSAFNKLFNNQFIEKGRKLLQSIQTLNIVIGKDLTDNTIEWAKELERAFGISAAGLISDLQGVSAILYGLGMNSKETELAGRNLLAIGQTLVGITGYDFNTVMTKLESGMKGMTQSIDDLGLSVRETQMDQFLKDLKKRGGEFSNIETSFQKLNEQQRIYVRYAALVNQFTSRFSAKDYIKSLDSITGRLTVLNARIDSLKTTLGNLILQIVDRITVPLAILVATIEKKIIQLAKLFGIDLQISSGMNKTAAGAAKAANSLGDVDNKLKDIENTADKAKGSLDAFDHITTISSSNGSDSGSPFDYSNLLTAVPDYAKQLEDLAKLQDDWLEQQKNKILAKLKELGETIKNKISAWWKNLTGRIIDWNGITNKIKLILASLKQVGANIKKIFKGAFDIVAGLIGMILDDLNALTLLDSFSRLLASITGFLATFFEKIKEPLFKFYNTYLKKYVEEIGKWLNSKLLSLINKFDMLKAWWSDDANKPLIEAWFDEAGKKVDSFVDKVKKAFTVLKVAVFGLSIDDAQAGKYEGIDPKILDTANNLHTIFSEIAGIVSDLLRDLGQFMVTDGLKQVADHIERISKMLSENHEGYVKVIEGCANAINKIKEAVLTKIESILDWIGKNPELVVTMLDKVSDILSGMIKHIEVIVGLIGVAKITLWVTSIVTAISTVKKLSAAIQVLSAAKTLKQVKDTVDVTEAGWAALSEANGVPTAGGTAAGKGMLGSAKVPSIGSMLPGAVQTAAGWTLPITLGLVLGVEGIRRNWDQLINTAIADNTTIREDAEKTIKFMQENYGQVTTSMLDAAQEHYKQLLINNNNLTQQQIEEYTNTYRSLMEHASKDYWGNKQIVDDSKEIEQATNKINEGNKKVSSSIDGMSNSANKASGSLATTADNINILSTTEAESKQTTQDFISLLDEARTTGVKAGSQINNRFSMLSMSLQRSKTNGEELCNVLDKLAERADKINSISLSMNAVKNNTTGVTKAKGYASGGVPKKGSIFFANENGNLELTGNFGGYNGVANQNMIIQSMQRAIASGMYDAINEAMSNNSNNTGVTNIEICKQGMFVGDDNAVRKLANKLNNALISSNGNIANKAFSLG